jgi:biotin carboxyl carrier protein
MTPFQAMINGESVSGTWHRSPDGTINATIGDRSYVLHASNVERGIYWVKVGNRSLDVVVVPGAQSYAVTVEGRRFNVEIEDARAALRRTATRGHEGSAQIKAPMPGKIIRILTTEGAEIATNQGLVIMEAMKMQNEIKSPKAGIVKKLCVMEGAAVNAGDLLGIVE